MFELPEHLGMGVTAAGLGPVCEGEPEFDHIACWCGRPGCTEYTNLEAR
jgi:hypothetical protein